MTVKTVNDSPRAWTSLSRSNRKAWTYGAPGYDKNAGCDRDRPGRRANDEAKPRFRVPRHLEMNVDEPECRIKRKSKSKPDRCPIRVVVRQQNRA